MRPQKKTKIEKYQMKIQNFKKIQQEVKSVPRGPVQTTEDFYANERLGYSLFGCLCWRAGARSSWHFLFSRVLEKTAAYAVTCFDRVYDTADWGDSTVLSQWTDGLKQLKCGPMLGSQ